MAFDDARKRGEARKIRDSWSRLKMLNIKHTGDTDSRDLGAGPGATSRLQALNQFTSLHLSLLMGHVHVTMPTTEHRS